MARILMNLIVLYLVALIYDVNGKLSNKLVGGSNALITTYPFQVSVRYHDDHHLCSGTIISPLHILTSASCVTSDINVIYSNLKILSGTGDVNNRNLFGLLSGVALVIIHHAYSPRNFWANDISILKLTTSLVTTLTRKPINSPELLVKQAFRVQMIGFKSSNGLISRISASSLSHFECKNSFGEYSLIILGQSCIKTREASDQITEGDGGNPILSTASKSFIGIVSLIATQPNNPTVITDLFGYYDKWMQLTTENY